MDRETVADARAVPDEPALQSAWPNPYQRSSGRHIAFRVTLNTVSRVELRVYNVLGQEVYRSAVAGDLPVGEHAMTWNGRRQNNQPLANGIYFASLLIDGAPRLQQKILIVD